MINNGSINKIEEASYTPYDKAKVIEEVDQEASPTSKPSLADYSHKNLVKYSAI